MRCAVLACVAFETVKVVRPVTFYGADEVHLFHYSRSGDDIYGKFYSEVVRLLKLGVPGIRIVEHSKDPVYDFPAMLRALLDCISKAEADGCDRVLVNASSGPAQFTAAAVVGWFTLDASVITAGAAYLQGYIFDCIFAGLHFAFSGYFCACGRSEFSFLHNVIAIVTARIPLAYLASVWYPDTLLPMGLATCLGSVVSVVICVAVYRWLPQCHD